MPCAIDLTKLLQRAILYSRRESTELISASPDEKQLPPSRSGSLNNWYPGYLIDRWRWAPADRFIASVARTMRSGASGTVLPVWIPIAKEQNRILTIRACMQFQKVIDSGTEFRYWRHNSGISTILFYLW